MAVADWDNSEYLMSSTCSAAISAFMMRLWVASWLFNVTEMFASLIPTRICVEPMDCSVVLTVVIAVFTFIQLWVTRRQSEL